jgi:hypothetical protein
VSFRSTWKLCGLRYAITKAIARSRVLRALRFNRFVKIDKCRWCSWDKPNVVPFFNGKPAIESGLAAASIFSFMGRGVLRGFENENGRRVLKDGRVVVGERRGKVDLIIT